MYMNTDLVGKLGKQCKSVARRAEKGLQMIWIQRVCSMKQKKKKKKEKSSVYVGEK